jgi:hypothetical protein
MSTVWFVLQNPIASLWRGIEGASWERLCAKLFGFNEAEIQLDQGSTGYSLLRDPTTYDREELYNKFDRTMYGHLDETKRFVPESILSHRVAYIALSCMQYLHRQDRNNSSMQDNLLAAWATKSKQLPWLWRQRIRVPRQDADSQLRIAMCLNIHFPRASDDHTRCYIPKGSNQRSSIRSDIYSTCGLSTSSTILFAQQ